MAPHAAQAPPQVPSLPGPFPAATVAPERPRARARPLAVRHPPPRAQTWAAAAPRPPPVPRGRRALGGSSGAARAEGHSAVRARRHAQSRARTLPHSRTSPARTHARTPPVE